MSRFETTRRQQCPRCERVTEHDVTTYLDAPFGPHEVVYCTECGR